MMLENLFNLIKEQSSESVIENPVIPNDQNNAVLADATHAVADGLQGVLAGGGLQNILSMFTGQNANTSGGMSDLNNNPIVGNIINSFTNKLTNNHGIPGEQAGSIASNLIPNVISNLIQKTNDPGNSNFNINSIIGSLSGGGAGSFDLQGILSNFTQGGLDSNGDGNIGFDDIMSKITHNTRQE